MKVRIILLLMLVIPLIGKAHHEEEAMSPWVAGTVVTERDVAAYGIDKCFVAEEISDAVFARMWNKSYKTNCTVPRSELRYLRVLHRDNKGRILLGEMVCNQAIANDLVEIFRELYKAAYPIERMVLIDEYDADDERSMEQNNSRTMPVGWRWISTPSITPIAGHAPTDQPWCSPPMASPTSTGNGSSLTKS